MGIISYLVTGLLWCGWLEYYTTSVMNLRPWILNERLFHTFLWPVSIGVFIYNFLKG